MAVVGIVGSLRSRSVNRLLLAAFGGELAPLDQMVTLEGLAQIPHYSQDRDGAEPPLGPGDCARRSLLPPRSS